MEPQVPSLPLLSAQAWAAAVDIGLGPLPGMSATEITSQELKQAGETSECRDFLPLLVACGH